MTHPAKAYWADRTWAIPRFARWDGKQWRRIGAETYLRLIEGLKE